MSRWAASHADRWSALSLVAGAVGFFVLAFAASFDFSAVLPVYLAAVIGWTATSGGSLALLMMMALVGGAWREELDSPLRAACRTFPVAALLFLPVLFGVAYLFPWTGAASESWTGFKAAWLSPWPFALRTVVYFAIWIGFATLLLRTREVQPRCTALGLILYTLTVSLAGVDWAMSVDTEFTSSIYGLIFLSHQLVAALALAIAVRTLNGGGSDRNSLLSGLLIAAILLWAYLHAMQYVIIWAGDLPEEIKWYADRSTDGWRTMLWVIGLFQFAIPFVVLLSSRLRSNAYAVGIIALLTLGMRLLEPFWLILPAFDNRLWGALATGGLALASTAAVGGIWTAAFLRALRNAAPGHATAMEQRHGRL